MRVFKNPTRHFPAARLWWLILVLLSMLALPFGAQAQITAPIVTVNAVTANSITIAWTAVSGATGYEYETRLPYETLPAQTSASTRSVTITGLQPGTLYGYVVRAIVNGEKSDVSNVGVQTTSPIAPGNLRDICVAGTVVQLVWDDSPGANAYEVKIGSGSWQSRDKSTSRIFSQLTLGTAYIFYVRALVPAHDAFAMLDAFSGETSISVTTQPAHVDPPTNLQTSEITNNGIKLTWTASPTSGVTSYEVSSDGSAWVDSGSDLEHSFTGLDADTSYQLRARAKTSAATSCPASAAAVKTLPNAPAAPTSLTTSGITQTGITLSWTKSTGATAYKVRKDSGDSWTTLGDVATYSFTGLTANTEYDLEVLASNAGGDSAAASVTVSTLPNAPAAPTSLTTSGITQTGITLSWTKSTGATAYKVRTGATGAFTTLGDVATYTFSGLTANTQYTLQVLASNAGGDSAAASVTVSTLPNAPAAPTSLTTSGITQTGITLSWTKSTGATAYKVRKDSGDSWTTLGDVATYSFTGLTANTQYTLEALASNAGGDSAAASVSATTLPNAPAAPTGLTTSGITQTGVTLSWTKSAGATAYKVRKDSGDSWTALGDVATYSFTGLTANTEYDLEVLASNAGGDSAAASVSATTLLNAPAAPTGLTTSGITQTGVTLSWTKSAGATAYKVRKDSGDSWTALGDVATYNFTGLTANTAYTLQVLASNAGGDSAAASVSATTLPNAPAAPTSLTTSGITQTGITLSWTKSAGATAYKVRKDSGDSWTVLGDVATYNFTGLTAGTSYDLEVSATNTGGDSAAASVTAVTVPAAPTGLSTSGITQTSITLNWTASEGATSYEIQGGGHNSWHDVGDVETYIFTGLTANTQYTLQVRAKNSAGESAAASVSARALATQPVTLTPPSSVTTSGIAQTSITLNWNGPSAATSYEVKGGVRTSWHDVGNVTAYEFTGLSADTQYTLQVRAKNSQTTSTDVSVSERTLPNPPAPPSGLEASLTEPNSVEVEWDESEGADSYEVQGTESSDDPVSQAAPVGMISNWMNVGNVNSYVISGLSPNTQYTFEVRAVNLGGASEPSDPIDFLIEPDQPAEQPVADFGQGGGGSGQIDGDSRESGSESTPPDDGAYIVPTATLSWPAFNCTDQQQAMIEISTQPIGLNLQCVGPVGVGNADLVARGIVLGVDVWGWVRNFEVCFKGAGELVFLDAAYAPRLLTTVNAYSRAGMICSKLDRAGTLVLLGGSSSTRQLPVTAQAPTATQAVAVQSRISDCEATTTDPLNLRATPGGQILLTLPASTTLSVYDEQSGWLQVEYDGQTGWVSSVYTLLSGNCG